MSNIPDNRRIAFFAPHATYPINYAAKAASLGGYEVYCFLKEEISYENGDHESCYRALKKDPNINVLNPDNGVSGNFSHLFVCWSVAYHYTSQDYQMICDLMEHSQCVGALCHVWCRERWQSLKGTLKYATSYPRLFMRTKSFGYEELPQFPNWHRVRSRSYWVGGGPHPHSLHDASVQSALYLDWRPNDKRRYKLAFGGSALPESRTVLLQKIEEYLRDCDEVTVTDNTDVIRTGGTTAFIRTYVPGQPRQLASMEYYSLLADTDFTLCLPGYTLWTNRPIEALLRGSIPVIDEQEIQRFIDLPLVHMKNCVVVKKGDWTLAVGQLLNLKHENIIRMRADVYEIKKNYLDLDVWGQRLRKKMGI